MRDATPVLEVSGLTVEHVLGGAAVPTLRDVALRLHRGRVLGLAGESGSGKSTAALASLGWSTPVQRRVAGRSDLDGVALLDLEPRQLRKVWGRRIGYVPQEIGGSLHPTYRIRTLFRETLKLNRAMGRGEADRRAVELLAAARIPEPDAALRRYAHQFSGGQQQRIAIALALAPGPEVLILDEPTTGLDVTTQRAVADTLRDLVRREQVAALFISHDLALLAELADDLAVMYAGEVVELGPAAAVLHAPGHPYTRALLDSLPSPRSATIPRGIPGLPPGRTISGACAFAPRCPHRVDDCTTREPPLRDAEGSRVRCLRVGEIALEPAEREPRPSAAERGPAPELRVTGLRCRYGRGRGATVAVDDVGCHVDRGGITALVGESGSGKSTLGRAVAGLLTADEGVIELGGRALPRSPRARTAADRKAVQLVFQDPAASLNPKRRVGDLLAHVARHFLTDLSREQRAAEVEAVLREVQLSPELMGRFPAQLSGGQKQRVAIAAAFVAQPRLVICDEITSGQDVSVQAAILRTLATLQQRHGTAVLFISHDLGVVRAVADHVYVMKGGRIVEDGPTERLFERPGHDYTKALLVGVPDALTIANHDARVL